MDQLHDLARRFDAGEFDPPPPPLSLEERLRAAVDAGYYVADAPAITDLDAEPVQLTPVEGLCSRTPESLVNRWWNQRKG